MKLKRYLLFFFIFCSFQCATIHKEIIQEDYKNNTRQVENVENKYLVADAIIPSVLGLIHPAFIGIAVISIVTDHLTGALYHKKVTK